MNKSNISGDSIIVMGAPMAKGEKDIVIPPENSGKKVIEEGTIELAVEKNNPEILKKLAEQKGKGRED